MRLKKWANATVAKYNNKRTIVSKDDEGYTVVFQKLKEEGEEAKVISVTDIEGKILTHGFKLTREGALSLMKCLASELYRDEVEEFLENI